MSISGKSLPVFFVTRVVGNIPVNDSLITGFVSDLVTDSVFQDSSLDLVCKIPVPVICCGKALLLIFLPGHDGITFFVIQSDDRRHLVFSCPEKPGYSKNKEKRTENKNKKGGCPRELFQERFFPTSCSGGSV